MVKNIVIVACAASFMFAGLGFHMANNYTNMDAGTATATSWGATFDLNETSTIGFDSELGMLYSFTVPMGVSFRVGADTTSPAGTNGLGTSVGLGFTWWTGGAGLKTSISTAYDMCSDNAGAGSTNNLSLTVGFGF